ncbi:hypothetical protein O3M35_005476 [Rhynocoris fuscipes]|uniref:Carboxypeptidase n=1 Tax=Rhynocoris fuscipes TaxID=488301 RepID=A0AAW1DL09_9HEMI
MCSSLVLILALGAVLAEQQPVDNEVNTEVIENNDELFRKIYPTWIPTPSDTRDDLAKVLLLTDYVNKGDIEKARELSKVNLGPLKSFAGYLGVEPKHNSHLFFWFFPAQDGNAKAPLILWLQGGPGATSLFGMFTEIGPYTVQNDRLELMPNSWNQNYSLLFIDNPVGTGFSFTDAEDGYATSQKQIADQLYKALIQFFTIFPEQQDPPFYIAGESYAGKHIPSLAYEIDRRNPSSDLWINLKGNSIFINYFHVTL